MRIGLQTWGTRGDIRPMLALSGGLKAAGHDVTLVVTSVDDARYDALAERLSVKLQSVASPVMQDQADFQELSSELFRDTKALSQAKEIFRLFFEPVADEMHAAAQALCRDCDLVVGHFLHYPLRIAAERAGCPHASVMLVHSPVPSRHYPPAVVPSFGGWANRLLWRLVRGQLNRSIKPFADRLRVKEGLAPARDLLEDVWASRRLNLIAVSEAFGRRQDDWGDQHQICGFLDLPADGQGHEISADLEGFLKQGPAPVYVGFGSVPVAEKESQREQVRLFAAVAERVRCRMIVQVPSLEACGSDLTGQVHLVTAAPHALVFPRCAAVVHHGGAGTVHAATKAGVPSLVVAHIHEQHFWGRELQRIGVAPAPLWRRELNLDSASKRLELILRTPGMKERAERAASVIGKEDGVATAVTLIEEHFAVSN